MSIENEIKDLTDAIMELTASITGTQVQPKNKVIAAIEDLVKKPKEKVNLAEALENSPEITAQQVKELAKKKMAEGVERTTIKALIVELKAESIADLTGQDRTILHKQLEAL